MAEDRGGQRRTDAASAPAPEIDPVHSARVITSLLLMFVVLAGIFLMREGAYFDNTADGERLFLIAFLGGAIAGFAGWTRLTGITPALSMSVPMRQLWLATVLGALVCTIGASWLNRTFATPTGQSRTMEIVSVTEGRAGRWHVIVRAADDGRERYVIPERIVPQLKEAKRVRMGYARGLLGFDYVGEFEPVMP